MNSTAPAFWGGIIGDPTVIGWLTVVAYMLAACISAAFARRADRVFPLNYAGRHRVLWWGIALTLLLLGLNKQLDFQSWLTSIGREMAYVQGWYDVRRIFQVRFIIGIAGVGFCLLVLLFWTVRHVLRFYWITMLGFVALISFILIRAASFHYVDILLGLQLAGFRLNWLIELGGIACVGLSAVLNLRRARRGTPFTTPTDVGGIVYRAGAAGTTDILLVKKPHGSWTLPRGRIEPDEAADEAVERVILEKTGLTGESFLPLHQLVHKVNTGGRRERRTVTYYLVQAATADPDPGDPTTQIGWFPIETALRHVARERAYEVVLAARKSLTPSLQAQKVARAY